MVRGATRVARVVLLTAACLLPGHLSAFADETDIPQEAADDSVNVTYGASGDASREWSSVADGHGQQVGWDNRVFASPANTLHAWTNQSHSFDSMTR